MTVKENIIFFGVGGCKAFVVFKTGERINVFNVNSLDSNGFSLSVIPTIVFVKACRVNQHQCSIDARNWIAAPRP